MEETYFDKLPKELLEVIAQKVKIGNTMSLFIYQRSWHIEDIFVREGVLTRDINDKIQTLFSSKYQPNSFPVCGKEALYQVILNEFKDIIGSYRPYYIYICNTDVVPPKKFDSVTTMFEYMKKMKAYRYQIPNMKNLSSNASNETKIKRLKKILSPAVEIFFQNPTE
jgi:Ni,Fe-hydrogenase III small subunit